MKEIVLGYFGNIWVKQHVHECVGDSYGGHKHTFDHVTLLAAGRVSVEIEGHPVKEFTAPTFIVIRKEHEHKITSLQADTVYYCVFALRDLDGQVTEIFGEQNDPLTNVGPST
jgi:hypothetical protein